MDDIYHQLSQIEKGIVTPPGLRPEIGNKLTNISWVGADFLALFFCTA